MYIHFPSACFVGVIQSKIKSLWALIYSEGKTDLETLEDRWGFPQLTGEKFQFACLLYC
jgi:hypothetical protein